MEYNIKEIRILELSGSCQTFLQTFNKFHRYKVYKVLKDQK